MPNIKNGTMTHEIVQEYYGKALESRKDLKTGACCSTDSLPETHKKILGQIEEEILEKFYGCGSPIPPALEGKTVLDLGCGSGRDVYLLSKLVGAEGFVVGVDMTDEQLAVGQKHLQTQMKRFRYASPNVDFRKGYIEDLHTVGIDDNSIDVVVSNCVINLSPDKKQVFSEIFRVLKPGGELYFSDVFSGRRIPEALKNDPLLYGECLSGAMYIEDFRRLLRERGCLDYRVCSQRRIILDNPEIEAKAGMIDFYSMTIRVFKLDTLEDICEDYGQVAIYNGGIADSPHQFALDDHHVFITGKPLPVCGNTASMLQETRFSRYFTIIGDRSKHFGPFDCKPAASPAHEMTVNSGGSCC
jgi:SAM-dependent methyltransferase